MTKKDKQLVSPFNLFTRVEWQQLFFFLMLCFFFLQCHIMEQNGSGWPSSSERQRGPGAQRKGRTCETDIAEECCPAITDAERALTLPSELNKHFFFSCCSKALKKSWQRLQMASALAVWGSIKTPAALAGRRKKKVLSCSYSLFKTRRVRVRYEWQLDERS